MSMSARNEDLRLELLARFQQERGEMDLRAFLEGLRDDFFQRLAGKKRKTDFEFLEEFRVWQEWKEKQARAQAEHSRETLFLLLLWLFLLVLNEEDLERAVEKARSQDFERHHFFENHETQTHLIEMAAFAAGHDFQKIHTALSESRLVSATGEFHTTPPTTHVPYHRIAAAVEAAKAEGIAEKQLEVVESEALEERHRNV